MRSWHDFHIDGYAVDGIQRQISFSLVWPYKTQTDVHRSRIVFEDVEAYFLEHDLGSSIVSEFSEQPLSTFLEAWTDRFETSARWAGWPRVWRPVPHPRRPVETEREDALRLLTERNVKCIELGSSYGMSGWVLAANVREEWLDV